MNFIQAQEFLVSQCGQKIFTPRIEKAWHAHDSWREQQKMNHEKFVQRVKDLESRGKFPQAS
jgi:hypothetical protein